MNEYEKKYLLMVGFLKGLIGEAKYTLIVDPEAIRSFIKEMESA